MKIAVLYSLPTERASTTQFVGADDDTAASAKEVAEALQEKGAQVELVSVSEHSLEKIKDIAADLVFNMIEWDGLDIPIAMAAYDFLDALPVPYTGTTKEGYLLCSDKALHKKGFDAHSIPTARWQVFVSGTEPIRDDFVYPVIVKLTLNHCSVGISEMAVIHKREDLEPRIAKQFIQHTQPVLVEEFIDGPELQVTMLERATGLTMLPPAQILFKKTGTHALLTFEGRWVESHPDYGDSSVGLANVRTEQLARLEKTCMKAFTDMMLRDYGRLDIRMRGDEIYLLEANANAGLGDAEDYGMTVSYKAAGMTFADFIWEIVLSALRRSSS